jgi:hypothetical protein
LNLEKPTSWYDPTILPTLILETFTYGFQTHLKAIKIKRCSCLHYFLENLAKALLPHLKPFFFQSCHDMIIAEHLANNYSWDPCLVVVDDLVLLVRFVTCCLWFVYLKIIF